MDRQLIDYLPPVLKTAREMQAVLITAEQPEFSGAWDSADAAFNDQYISDATENGVSRWESMLGIVPKGTDALDDRKFRILSRLNESLPYTMEMLRQMLTSLCGAGGYTLELQSDIYTLIVRVDLSVQSKLDDVKSLLERVIPANMVIDLSLLFMTYGELTAYTYDYLSNYSCDQIRNREVM